MTIANPFNVDAVLSTENELAALPPQGGMGVAAFCGLDGSVQDWDERGVCVLQGRRGFGKSHLLAVRSRNHRDSAAGSRTIFYPQGGRPRLLCEVLSSLHTVVPRWLQGRESIGAWMHVWQLSILGLLVWATQSRAPNLPGYAQWFGSLELLDRTYSGEQTDGAGSGQPNAMLTWFIARVVEKLPPDDYQEGVDRLKSGLYHADTDWAIAIRGGIESKGKSRIAMYLDAPDELVSLNPPNLWRSVQQGLLLAIWKFSKNSTWSRTLNIYATVRSEAFGSGHDHPDLALAMGLVMHLRYTRAELEAMLADRIRQVDPARLARPLGESSSALEALCGFDRVLHEDRAAIGHGQHVETVGEAILRHTRMVPREVIAIGGAIAEIGGQRTYETVRRAVNGQASQNIAYAIEHSFLGWTDSLHRRFAASLHGEVIDAATMSALTGEFGEEGPRMVKFFVQHGLLGTAEPLPERHRHCYRQRFSYDEVHGNEHSSSINKDYFFVHPAFKEWIRALPEQVGKTFAREPKAAIGDLEIFEAKPPLIRLGVDAGRVKLSVRREQEVEAYEKGAESDPLKFLFVVLWACRERKENRVSLGEIRALWTRLCRAELTSAALKVALPTREDAFAEKVRDWAKKINRDPQIRQIQRLCSLIPSGADTGRGRRSAKAIRPVPPFVSVSARSRVGAQAAVALPDLPIDEIDFAQPVRVLFDVGRRSCA